MIQVLLLIGNVTNFGYSLSTVYGYLTYIVCQPSSIITNNILKGYDRLTTNYLITVGGLINIVKNNVIYRHTFAKGCGAYVGFKLLQTGAPVSNAGVSGTAWTGEYLTCIITENVFDSPFTTGSTETHIYIPQAYTTAYSIIAERNVNQVSYVNIPLTSNNFKVASTFIPSLAASMGVENSVPTGMGTDMDTSNILRIRDLDDTTTKTVYFQDIINKYVPLDVKICNLKVGLRAFLNDTNTAPPAGALSIGTLFTLSITRQDNVSSSINLDTIGAATTYNDPHAISGLINSVNGAALNASAITSYATINLESPDLTLDYTTGRFRSYTAGLKMVWKPETGTTAVDVFISPILIKFRW